MTKVTKPTAMTTADQQIVVITDTSSLFPLPGLGDTDLANSDDPLNNSSSSSFISLKKQHNQHEQQTTTSSSSPPNSSSSLSSASSNSNLTLNESQQQQQETSINTNNNSSCAANPMNTSILINDDLDKVSSEDCEATSVRVAVR